MSKKMKSNILLLLTAFIWGSAFVAQKSGMDYIEPFTYNGIRTFIGGLVLIPVIIFFAKKNNKQSGKNEKAFDFERDKIAVIGGMFCGLALFVASSLQQFGDMLVLLCAIAFAVHIMVIDHFSPKADGVKISCVQFLFSGALGIICMFIFENPDLGNIIACWLPILYAGVLSCGVAYTLQVVAQADADPTAASLILCLESVFAVISGAILLHESMSPRELMGCAVIFVAVIISNLPEKKVKLADK